MNQHHKQEIANATTHGIAAILSMVGLTALTVATFPQGDTLKLFAVFTYGSTLVVMYFASTFYHLAYQKPVLQRKLKTVDHICIYLLTAGSYTPFALISMKGTPIGLIVFVTIWALAILGGIFKWFFTGKYKTISTVIYLIMGWLAILVYNPLIDAIGWDGFFWILAGGFFYSVGVVFYLWKTLPYSHAIWHVFVLLGSACHFIAVWRYVV